MSLNNEPLGTKAIGASNMKGFYTATNAGASFTAPVDTVDFNDGEWCSSFILTPADSSVATVTSI